MREKTLYPLWAFLYVLCIFLGAIPERSAAGNAVLTVISVLFFVPGALLLYLGFHEKRKKTVLTVRWISALSLVLTVIAIVANLLSVRSDSYVLGDVLHVILLVVSSPMLCADYWMLPLFLWACLLMVSIPWLWQTKNRKKS